MDEKNLKEMAAQLRQPAGDAGLKTGEFMNSGNRFMNEEAIRALKINKGERILELGMGNGHFVKQIFAASADVTYTGCDFSATMIAEAVKKNAEAVKAGKVRFLSGSAEALPFDNGSFDKAFSVNTIYFWKDTTKVLSEFYRVLAKGGELILSLRPRRHMEAYPFTKYGFTLYEPTEVVALLEKSGFTTVSYSEIQEPDFEYNGQMLKMEHMIVRGRRP